MRSKKQTAVLTTTYVPKVKGRGDVLQNIEITLEGYNKNGSQVSLRGEIDIYQASMLINDLKQVVKQHHECVLENINRFNDQLKPSL